jgi:hypothetical protein
VRAGRPISRIALAYEAGRDGFWLARWLIARGIEAHVIHSASVAVSRERKRAKTDRLAAPANASLSGIACSNAALNSSRAAIIRVCKVFTTSPLLRAASSDRTFELD